MGTKNLPKPSWEGRVQEEARGSSKEEKSGLYVPTLPVVMPNDRIRQHAWLATQSNTRARLSPPLSI